MSASSIGPSQPSRFSLVTASLDIEYAQLIREPVDPSQRKPIKPNSGDDRFVFNGAWWVLKGNALTCKNPLNDEYEQFWQMIWNLGVTTIITFNESRSEYAEKGDYWINIGSSEETPAYFKENETIFKREIPITFHGKKRTIFHYRLRWPDVEVVTPFMLALLVNFARLKERLLVHGNRDDVITTFFTAYEALLKGEKNIYPIALDMRNQMGGVNPTKEQYQLTHQTIQLFNGVFQPNPI